MLSVIYLLIFGLFVTNITCRTDFVIDGSRVCTQVTENYYEYDKFFVLSDITNMTLKLPIGYLVKIPISLITEYGDIHIILAETDSLEDNNRCYEFALGGWGNSRSEIRRKDNVREVEYTVASKFAKYKVPLNETINIELSVSIDGNVEFVDLDTQFEFKLLDVMDAIPVKYIGFTGYLGHETKYIFNCSNLPQTSNHSVLSRGSNLCLTRPTLVKCLYLLLLLLLFVS